jgi:predicted transcriptional regulator
MASKHRGQIEIIRELVSSSKSGARITHMMHAGNLAYASLLVYMDLLLKARLVEERSLGDARMYFATQKGLTFLRLFDELESLASPEIESPLFAQRDHLRLSY